MVLSTRGMLAIRLGIVGLSFLVGPTLAQQDPSVRKAANPTGGAAAPAAPVPPMIGTVDMDAVFKGYERFKVTSKEFQAAVLARQNELMKIKNEAEEEAQMLSKLTPGAEDFKKHENRVTELKARFAAGREQAQREFQARESENLATIYKEVSLMVTAIANWRKFNLIVRRDEPAAQRSRSQLGDGRIPEHHRLLRPAQRHHERCDLQPQSPIQGGREPRGRRKHYSPASGRSAS